MKTFLLSALAFMLFYQANAQVITTVAGGNGAGGAASQLNTPQGVFVDKAGNIYVADYLNSRIQKFPAGSTSATNAVTVAGGNGAGPGADQLSFPYAVYVDSSSNMYVADKNNNRIQEFPAGSTSNTNGVTVAASILMSPLGVFLDDSSNIYVSEWNSNSNIRKFPAGSIAATTGVIVAGGNGTGGSPFQFNQPNNIYIDDSGSIYVADYNNNRIQKFPAGSSSATAGITVAGGNGQGTAANQLYGPVGVYMDRSGYLYVSDEGNNRIQKFPPGSDSSTNAVTIVGDTIGGRGMNQLSYPNGIFVDSRGDVYIADGGNNRIQKYSITTAVNEVSEQMPLTLYPDPNIGNFILQSANSIGKEYFICDLPGRVIMQSIITADRQSIALNDIAAGSYILQIRGGKAIRFTIEK